tara:strand:+ start:199 stop:486 length:288 start_codon:yes stop_codon:yes gene_type:complete
MGKEAILLSWLLLCHFGNFADLSLTLYAIEHGVTEANPLMAWLLDISPFVFGAVKILAFSLAIELIAKKNPVLLKPIALFYMMVVAWHLSFVFRL